MSTMTIDQFASQFSQTRYGNAQGSGSWDTKVFDIDAWQVITGPSPQGTRHFFVGIIKNDGPNNDYSLKFGPEIQKIQEQGVLDPYVCIGVFSSQDELLTKYREKLVWMKSALMHLAANSPSQSVNNSVFNNNSNGMAFPSSQAAAQFAGAQGMTPTVHGIGFGNQGTAFSADFAPPSTTQHTATFPTPVAGFSSTPSQNPNGFGAAPSTGFGAAPSNGNAFPGQNPNGFGAAPSTGFGAPPSTGFGAAPSTGNAFPGQNPNGFGAAPTGFGTPSTGNNGNAFPGQNPNGFGPAPSTGFGAPSTSFAPPPVPVNHNNQMYNPVGAFGGAPNAMLGVQPAQMYYGGGNDNGPKSIYISMWATNKPKKGSYQQGPLTVDDVTKKNMVISLISNAAKYDGAKLNATTASSASLAGIKTPIVFTFSKIPQTLDEIPRVVANILNGNHPGPYVRFGTANTSSTKILDSSKGVSNIQQSISALFEIFIDTLKNPSTGAIDDSTLQAAINGSATGGFNNSFAPGNYPGTAGGSNFNNYPGTLPAPSTGFGPAPSTGFGPAPSTGFGPAPSTGFGAAPSNGNAFPGQNPNGFGPAPSTGNAFPGQNPNGFGPAPSTGFGPAPPTGFGAAPSIGNAFPGQNPTSFGAAPSTSTVQKAKRLDINKYYDQLKDFDVSKPYMQNVNAVIVSVIDGDTFKVGIARQIKNLHNCHSVSSNGKEKKKIVCLINGDSTSEDEIIELEMLRLAGIDAAEYHILPDENNPRDKGLNTHQQHTTFEGWFIHDLVTRLAEVLHNEDARVTVNFNGIDAHGRSLGHVMIGSIDLASVLLNVKFQGQTVAIQYAGVGKSDFSKNLNKFPFKETTENPQYRESMKNAVDAAWPEFIAAFGNYQKGVSNTDVNSLTNSMNGMSISAAPAPTGFSAAPAPTPTGFSAAPAPTPFTVGAATIVQPGSALPFGQAPPVNLMGQFVDAPTPNPFNATAAPNPFNATAAPNPFQNNQWGNNSVAPKINLTGPAFSMGRDDDDADSDNEVAENADVNGGDTASLLDKQFDVGLGDEPQVEERVVASPVVDDVVEGIDGMSDFDGFAGDGF